MTAQPTGEVIFHQRDDGAPALEVRLDAETVWLSQQQIAELLQTSRENITMHLGNVYEEGELDRDATCKDFLQVRQEGPRTVRRNVAHYNLDKIKSVSCRMAECTMIAPMDMLTEALGTSQQTGQTLRNAYEEDQVDRRTIHKDFLQVGGDGSAESVGILRTTTATRSPRSATGWCGMSAGVGAIVRRRLTR